MQLSSVSFESPRLSKRSFCRRLVGVGRQLVNRHPHFIASQRMFHRALLPGLCVALLES